MQGERTRNQWHHGDMYATEVMAAITALLARRFVVLTSYREMASLHLVAGPGHLFHDHSGLGTDTDIGQPGQGHCRYQQGQ